MKNKQVKTKKLINSTKLLVLSVLLCSANITYADNFDFAFPSPSNYIKNKNELASTLPTKNTTLQTTQKESYNVFDFDIPSPSSYAKYQEEKALNYDSGGFFAPVADNNEVETKQVMIPEKKEPTMQAVEIQETLDDNVFNSIDEGTNTPNPEGLEISEIRFEGLKAISSSTIYDRINVREGDKFNTKNLQQDLQKIYDIGYFTDKILISPEVNEDNTVTLTFELQENLIVEKIKIMGNSVVDTKNLEPFVNSLKNYPQNIANINISIDKITDYYHKQGYILAGVSSVDDEENTLIFRISEGVINNIIFDENKKTQDYVIARNILSEPGTVYNEEIFKKDLQRIYATNLFKQIDREIVPVENGEKGEYDIKIIVKEDSSNNVSIGMGIDSGLGLFGSMGISENNFMGKGQRVSLSGIVGSGILLSDASVKNRINYQFQLSFFEPYFLNADNSLSSKLYYRELGSYQIPLAIERRFGLMGNVTHKVKDNEHLTTNLGTGFEYIRLKEGDLTSIANMYAKNGLNFALREKQLTDGLFFNIAPGIKYSNLDSEENPTDGIIANARFIESLGADNLNDSSGRIMGGITKYFPVGEYSSFSLTARGGMKAHGNEMPEIFAFSLGGPYSVRGFRMNGVGLGDGFLMGSAELATPLPLMDRVKWDFFKKMRFVMFVDAGKVYEPTITSILYDRPMSAISAGVGLKFYIPNVGPISIDYGVPLTNVGHYGKKSGSFTFGAGMLDMYNY